MSADRPAIRFLGAAREVTGSMHLVETSAGTILVDCGFYQGRRDESRQRNARLPAAALAADAVILTHAHIDHSGSLPTLVRDGFRGTIWSTPATRDLCAYMLRDSARIQQADAQWLNRKHENDPDWTPIAPIYDEEDAIRAVARFASIPYGVRFQPLPGSPVWARFIDAGHILGSAQVQLELPAGGGSVEKVTFSGDLGRKGMPILRDPDPPGEPDVLVMESTYGSRAHGSLRETNDELARAVADVCAKKGKLIIPAFSLGRTQEIVYALHQLHSAKQIPEIPVFVDSPLSVKLTEVFKLHPECFDAETRKFLETDGDPFSFPQLRYVESVDESIRLNDLAGPAIIISASGMCESGRVLHHLKNNVEDEKSTILIVGFMAQHTLGRRLVERRKRVKILGVERELHARVLVMNGFSAHADCNDLAAYAKSAGSARRIFLVHGEPSEQEPFMAALAKGGRDVIAPSPGDHFVLE